MLGDQGAVRHLSPKDRHDTERPEDGGVCLRRGGTLVGGGGVGEVTMATYLYDVVSPILHPVAAKSGDIVAVRPGHPTRPVVVFQCIGDQWVPVAKGPPNCGAFLVREDEGFIRQIFASPSVPLAAHPLVQTA